MHMLMLKILKISQKIILSLVYASVIDFNITLEYPHI